MEFEGGEDVSFVRKERRRKKGRKKERAGGVKGRRKEGKRENASISPLNEMQFTKYKWTDWYYQGVK